MAEGQINGRSLAVIAKDVAEGLISINAYTLKRFDPGHYKTFYFHLQKVLKELRGQSFPSNDTLAIRKRNMQLQRLHQARTVVEYAAKEQRIAL